MGKLWKTAKWLLGTSAMFGAFVFAEWLRDSRVSPREYLNAAMTTVFFRNQRPAAQMVATATFCL